MKPSLQIYFASVELAPMAKVGGLADVASALPKALASRGNDVTIVLPGFSSLSDSGPSTLITTLAVQAGHEKVPFEVREHAYVDGVRLVGLHNPELFDKDVYVMDGDSRRFILFSKALIAWLASLDQKPDILHANDWHTSLALQELKQGKHAEALQHVRSLLTIHNLAYKGDVGPTEQALIDLPGSVNDNLLTRGIRYADVINTVSNQYRNEVLTQEFGMGLDELLRSRQEDFTGILNGLDYDQFNPATDPFLVSRFDCAHIEGKADNKAALQTKAGINVDPQVPLIGIVSRLVGQKGFDLLSESLDEVLDLGIQLVVVGEGEEKYHDMFDNAAKRFPSCVGFLPESDEGPARFVYGGADLFLAPSNYEPFGLGPIIAMHYGAVPVVRETGGLAETVIDYSTYPKTGTGFSFRDKTPPNLLAALQSALAVFDQQAEWRQLQRRGMETDFSWAHSAAAYEELYRKVLQAGV